MKAALSTFAPFTEATDQLMGQDLHDHRCDLTVLLGLCYAAETRADTVATSRKLLTTHRTFEKYLLKFNRHIQQISGLRGSNFRVMSGLRDSDFRVMSGLRDPAEYVLKAKHRRGGHIIRRIDDRWTKKR
ncbi:hypothetical protein RB195_019664 [Necator americanus]|uniref:Uncharacterized protein n=1 Tax=Necator americanus TaxID=51031 RepID=A0ABR1CHS0_NECAM